MNPTEDMETSILSSANFALPLSDPKNEDRASRLALLSIVTTPDERIDGPVLTMPRLAGLTVLETDSFVASMRWTDSSWEYSKWVEELRVQIPKGRMTLDKRALFISPVQLDSEIKESLKSILWTHGFESDFYHENDRQAISNYVRHKDFELVVYSSTTDPSRLGFDISKKVEELTLKIGWEVITSDQRFLCSLLRREMLSSRGIGPGLYLRYPSISNSRSDKLPPFPISKPKECWHLASGQTYILDGVTEIWWTRDLAQHGGSIFKAYRKVGSRLEYLYCADATGREIAGKHKGPTLRYIYFKNLVRCNSKRHLKVAP